MIGLIGIGLLGTAIAERLHAAGFPLLGWDLNAANLERASSARYVEKAEPEQLANVCDRIVLCLPNSEIVEQVVRQIEGRVRRGTVVVDTTTGSPHMVESIAKRLAGRDTEYVDACIGGSSEDVRQGRAAVLCGGSNNALSACLPLLQAISPRVSHLGAAGAGTRMKLVFNLVLGLNRAVLAEGLEFAQRSGIAMEDALRVLQEGAAYSRVMDTKGRKMLERHFEPQARLSQHLKDVRHILEEGADAGARLPLSELHARILEDVERAGYGAEDNSAVIRWFRGLD